ncbi:hypothetical protein [Gluconobacter morbifer]|uniref:Uncharacterized protein n=1 Tax=Gluconobacter morbifer G707 TaxID=1088869 RepID=G6XHL0_9PROT|nr:hypothetical protein [Gluconobacter morbifer]EHH69668.1 hypothetical protein GMO_09760 [Gluconobacter morbifer G707]
MSSDTVKTSSPEKSTGSGWAYDCAICGKGAAFGFYRPEGTTFYCRDHQNEGTATPYPPMSRTKGA